jgi:hypothetical protein
MLWPTNPRTTVCGVEQVLQLQYRVRWLSDDVSVRNDAAAVMVQLAGFSCSLSGETLIAEPSFEYSSVDAARAALEPALHAWEASSELNQGLRFSFEYTGSAVHDVASSQQRAVAIDDVVALSHAVQVSRVLGEFPKPDPSLPTEGSVAYELRLRWRAQREDRERLSGACYAILTGLESNLGGNLDKAAARLSVDEPVLSTSASSRRGKIPCTDGRTGRQGERPDRSRKQRSSGWRLSRRASSDGRPSTKRKCVPSRRFTMADLPPLSV